MGKHREFSTLNVVKKWVPPSFFLSNSSGALCKISYENAK